MISIVIAALNEAEALPATLRAAAVACPGAELIVVDGGSSDATVALAAAGGARIVHAPRGRGTQLRAGAAAARGDIIVLLHADTLLPPGAHHMIEHALADVRTAAGAFRLRFASVDGTPHTRGLRLLERWLNVRSRRLGMVTGDQALFTRANTLRAVGGVPGVPLFEDVRLVRALRAVGRIVLIDAAAATSPRLFLRHGPWRTATLHSLFRVLHAAGVTPQRLARWYPASAAPASGGRSRSARPARRRPVTPPS